jgi:hypothetical protein
MAYATLILSNHDHVYWKKGYRSIPFFAHSKALVLLTLYPAQYHQSANSSPVKRDPAQMYKWETGIYGGYTAQSFPWWDDTDVGTQLCDLCAHPIMADMIHVVELDDYCYHVCPD